MEWVLWNMDIYIVFTGSYLRSATWTTIIVEEIHRFYNDTSLHGQSTARESNI